MKTAARNRKHCGSRVLRTTHKHTFAVSLSLSHMYAHTHTHTHAHIHTQAHTYWSVWEALSEVLTAVDALACHQKIQLQYTHCQLRAATTASHVDSYVTQVIHFPVKRTIYYVTQVIHFPVKRTIMLHRWFTFLSNELSIMLHRWFTFLSNELSIMLHRRFTFLSNELSVSIKKSSHALMHFFKGSPSPPR